MPKNILVMGYFGWLISICLTETIAFAQTAPSDQVGLGTYATSAQFQSPQISANTQLLLQPDLSKKRGNFTFVRGEWRVVENSLQQTSADTGTRAVVPVDAADYTISVKAKKLSGKEGFLILFRVKDARNYAWFNVGGWNNTKAQVEVTSKGTRVAVGEAAGFTVEVGRWYDLKVEVVGKMATCYVDGVQLCRTDISPPRVGQGIVSERNVDAAENTAREAAIKQQLQSANKGQVAAGLLDLKQWYGEDAVNAEHAMWRQRALLVPLKEHVGETMELIKLAWASKNSPEGDKSDPGYLYALEASCLLEQGKAEEAKAKAGEGLPSIPPVPPGDSNWTTDSTGVVSMTFYVMRARVSRECGGGGLLRNWGLIR